MKKIIFAVMATAALLCSCSDSDSSGSSKSESTVTKAADASVTTSATKAEESKPDETKTEKATETTTTKKTESSAKEDEKPEYTVLWAILPDVNASYFDANYNNANLVCSLNDAQVERISEISELYEEKLEELSDNAFDVKVDVLVSKKPVSTLSWYSENSYYVDYCDLPEDIIKAAENYDCVMSCANLDDGTGSVGTDYWGLTAIDKIPLGWSYGFVQILYNDYFLYDENSNVFCEEVWVHEWLHTLEGRMSDYCFVPSADGSEYYGYSAGEKDSFYEFYQDILRCEVVDPNTGEKIGMTDEAWKHVGD